jgi:predicted HAD superfamily hydrolase
MRRMDKIFKTMAIFIGTREAEQCRSHHQKMEKKYNGSIYSILLNLRRQHYHTEDQTQMECEIALNQIELYDGLLSVKFLMEEAERF